MLAAVAIIAMPLATLAARPSSASGLAMMLLTVAFPPMCWVGSKCGGRYLHAFCLWAFAPALAAALFVSLSLVTMRGVLPETFNELLEVVEALAGFYRFLLVVFWGLMPLAGLLCMFVCWSLERRNSNTI